MINVMNEPLVSISIITYNSSKYIEEALEGAKAQTYKNIELIVSDDCSTDDTVEIVMSWMAKNESRFVRTKLLTVEKNTGPVENEKRARGECHGEWTKETAGDDVLIPTCVQDNLNYVHEHPDAQVIVSNSIIFFDNTKREVRQVPGLLVPNFFELDAREQHKKFLKYDILMNSSSQFTKTTLFQEIKLDERIKYLDDRQFYWYCTAQGVKIHYLDKETVRYRKHSGALTGIHGKNLVSLNYYDSWVSFFYVVRKPEMDAAYIDTYLDERRVLWYLFIKHILKNKANIVNRIIFKAVEKWCFKLKDIK